MAERAKDSGPEWNGLRSGPVTSLTEALKSLPGDQFHLLSRPNSDQPSVSISSRDTDRGLGEPETLMALISEYDGYEDAKERWETDRYQNKWSLATKLKMIALIAVAFAIVIAIPLVFFENNRRLADATAPLIVVPKQTATETAPAVARKSAETPLATAEQNRPRDPANGLNPGPTADTAADAKSVAQDQNAPPQAPAATQGPARSVDKEELANALIPADTKSMDQGQNVSPQAPVATQSPARTVDKEELATGPSPEQSAADAKSMVQGQNAAPQMTAGAQSPTATIDQEKLATGPSPDQTAADAKSMAQVQDARPQALAATQKPTGTIDQQQLAAGPIPDQTAAVTKPVGQAQVATPEAPAATQSPERTIDKEQLASLLKRGRYLLSVGDIASARLLLARAADAHDASAAFDLAGTYDPAVLRRSHVFGIAPDIAMARMWYERALSLGQLEARERLTQLQK